MKRRTLPRTLIATLLILQMTWVWSILPAAGVLCVEAEGGFVIEMRGDLSCRASLEAPSPREVLESDCCGPCGDHALGPSYGEAQTSRDVLTSLPCASPAGLAGPETEVTTWRPSLRALTPRPRHPTALSSVQLLC